VKNRPILLALASVFSASLLHAQPEPSYDGNGNAIWGKDNIWSKNMELIKSVKAPANDGTGGGVGEYFQMFDDVAHVYLCDVGATNCRSTCYSHSKTESR